MILKRWFPSLLAIASLVTAVAAQTTAPQAPQNASPAAPLNVTPPKPPVVPPSADPASSHFLTEAGILLVTIKPAAAVDYEMVIRTLQEALSKDTDPTRSTAAKSWLVFKASETDAKGNAIYVHVMMPTVTGFDYRPSLLLDDLIKDLDRDLLSKYQDAFAAPPTRLNLTQLANMSVAPLPLPPPEPKKPPGD